ncbi:hypothetical protein PENSPDRAFT_334339 [Peniophora sp. CONT]|nr:hypothetical protein PENSPDRAFT_334339 [Peniophora sp. CONT]
MLIIDAWLRLSDAYHQHMDGRCINEFIMPQGVDQALQLVARRTSCSKVLMECSIHLPYSPVGPSGKAEATANALLPFVTPLTDVDIQTLTISAAKQLSLFELALDICRTIYKVALVPLIVQFRHDLVHEGGNQIMMNLVAATRFARFLGFGEGDITVYGCSVGAYQYQVYSATLDPFNGESIIIKRYDRRPLTSFCDFVRLYVLLAEISDRIFDHLDGRTVD